MSIADPIIHKKPPIMNLIEKILARHSNQKSVQPGDIIDVHIDARAARDFGGANVVKNLINNGLKINDPNRTFFTFDCNPGGSDQKYAANQQYCRMYARENDIRVYDINAGIGTHLAIDQGLILPGGTFVSTDSHANIMGAIGAFGQGMGDQDIAAVWAHGKAWFKVPQSAQIILKGKRPPELSAKDLVLNLLHHFGANTLLQYSVELKGDCIEELTLDERITISSMATEMGAIILLIPPTQKLIQTLESKTHKTIQPIWADPDAHYDQTYELDLSQFVPMVARPGHPHDDVSLEKVMGQKIDSAFIGSCTNGRIEDLRIAAHILQRHPVAPGVVLKIVPATDAIWKQALEEGLIHVLKSAGALISNAGCAGCAAGQVGQNGPKEVSISTGNRNFAGKQGKGAVYLASPATVAASAAAGYITQPKQIPENPAPFQKTGQLDLKEPIQNPYPNGRPSCAEGHVWIIPENNIDTDMIFHNRYLTITDIHEMGQYTFDNLPGFEHFAKEANPCDIIITGKNFGAGSSRQQAVDCFKSLEISCILAESFGAIYERNAINAALPILTFSPQHLSEAGIENGDKIRVNFITGNLLNITKGKTTHIEPFNPIQMKIYKNGGLLVV